MNLWLTSPLFWLGLAVRVALLTMVTAPPVQDWYIPFLQSSIEYWSLDPWASWLNHSGSPLAFPYGYAMWLFFSPWIVLAKLTHLPIIYGYGLAVITADLIVLWVLNKLFPNKFNSLLGIYWLSPIILIATYALGYNDLVPISFLFLSIYFLKCHRFLFSAFLLVTAISAKLSMIITLPFFVIYFIHNRAIFQKAPQFFYGLLISSSVLLVPFIFSSAGIQMVLTNPEVAKVYQLSFPILSTVEIYLVPLVYLLMLYLAWQIKRINFDLFYTFLGLAFLVIVLLIPASPGWFVWTIPLLVSYQLSNDRFAMGLSSLFYVLYFICIGFSLLTNQDATINLLSLDHDFVFQLSSFAHLNSLFYTALVATGLVLINRIWKINIFRNDFFRLSRKPFVIGIAGDSGSGKDSYANALIDLFGKHSATHISGDDYHLWDRKKPIWKLLTHINPAANDLERFTNDLISLVDGKSIRVRHYDHQTGLSGRPIKLSSNDLIIASGLHALYLPILRSCYDLSIYLDINEDLRRYLKVWRDVKDRGYTKNHVLNSLEERQADSLQFIHPQANSADLVLSLQPAIMAELEDQIDPKSLHLKLKVRSRQGFNELSLKRVLVGICGLHVEVEHNPMNSEVTLLIEGECHADDVAIATRTLYPNIFDFLDFQPQWHNGITGLLQIVTISHIHQALTKRFI
jgi:uridine kinase